MSCGKHPPKPYKVMLIALPRVEAKTFGRSSNITGFTLPTDRHGHAGSPRNSVVFVSGSLELILLLVHACNAGNIAEVQSAMKPSDDERG